MWCGIFYFVFMLIFLTALSQSLDTVNKHGECREVELKCTDKDPREQIYPWCMLGSTDLTLYCDQSIYKAIPDPTEVDEHLPKKLGSCVEAKSLRIDDSCLEGVNAATLKKYPKIQSFYCGRNSITKLTRNMFSGNEELTVVDFCTNKIGEIETRAFAGLDKLEVLNLDNNKISELRPYTFFELNSLQELSLHNNKLQVLGVNMFRGLYRLKELTLTANKIRVIKDGTFLSLTRLTHLYLDENRLSTIEMHAFDGLYSLQYLGLSYNELGHIPRGPFENLHTLNLGFNYIADIGSTQVVNMSKLQNFSLENNSLSTLPEDVFDGNLHMRHINLASNNLREIPRTTFDKLCHLQFLSLRDNSLTTAYAGWFKNAEHNDGPLEMEVSGNQWHCDCEILDFLKFVESIRDERLRETLEIKCTTPKKLSGDKLDRYSREEILGVTGCVTFNEPLVSPCIKSPDFVSVSFQLYSRSAKITTQSTTTNLPTLSATQMLATFPDFYVDKRSNPILSTESEKLPLVISAVACIIIIINIMSIIYYVHRRNMRRPKKQLSVEEGKNRPRENSRTDGKFESKSSIIDPDQINQQNSNQSAIVIGKNSSNQTCTTYNPMHSPQTEMNITKTQTPPISQRHIHSISSLAGSIDSFKNDHSEVSMVMDASNTTYTTMQPINKSPSDKRAMTIQTTPAHIPPNTSRIKPGEDMFGTEVRNRPEGMSMLTPTVPKRYDNDSDDSLISNC